MSGLIPILIQVVVGALGGNGVAAMLKGQNLSKVVATITGVIGGVGGGQLAGLTGILEQLGVAMNGADAGTMVGSAVASGAGGAILTAVVAYIQKAMAAGKAA